jgi:hypothetical protein
MFSPGTWPTPVRDMTDAFADRQVDGSDLVSGEENTALAVI